jgi:hypothetical protein
MNTISNFFSLITNEGGQKRPLGSFKKCKWKFQIFIYITIELNKSRNTVVRALFIGKRVSHKTFFYYTRICKQN